MIPKRTSPTTSRRGSVHSSPMRTSSDVTVSSMFDSISRTIEVDPQRKLLWSAEDSYLRVRSLATGSILHEIEIRSKTFINAMTLVNGKLWCGASDGNVYVYDSVRYRLEAHFLQHDKAIQCIHYNGHKVYTGGADWKVYEWDVERVDYERLLHGHSNSVRSLAHSNAFGGGVVMSGSDDGTIRLWAVGSQASEAGNGCPPTLAVLRGHVGGVLSLHVIPSLRGVELWSGGEDCSVRVWELDTFQNVCVIEKHTGPVTSIVSVGSSSVWSSGKEGKVYEWDVNTHRQAPHAPADGVTIPTKYIHAVKVVSCCRGCKMLVTASEGATMSVTVGHQQLAGEDDPTTANQIVVRAPVSTTTVPTTTTRQHGDRELERYRQFLVKLEERNRELEQENEAQYQKRADAELRLQKATELCKKLEDQIAHSVVGSTHSSPNPQRSLSGDGMTSTHNPNRTRVVAKSVAAPKVIDEEAIAKLIAETARADDAEAQIAILKADVEYYDIRHRADVDEWKEKYRREVDKANRAEAQRNAALKELEHQLLLAKNDNESISKKLMQTEVSAHYSISKTHKAGEEAQARISELEDVVQRKSNEIISLFTQLSSEKKHVQTLEEELAQTKSTMFSPRSTSENISKMQQTIKTWQDKTRLEMDRANAAENDVTVLKSDLEYLRNKSEKERERLKKDIEDYKAAALQNEAALAQSQRELHMEILKTQKLEGEKEILSNQLVDTQTCLLDSKRQAQQISKALSELQQQQLQRQSEVSSPTNADKKRYQEEMARADSLEVELNHVRELHNRAISQVASEKKRCQLIEEELGQLKAEFLSPKSATENMMKLHQTIKSLQDKYRNESERADVAEAEATTARSDMEYLRNKLEKERERLRKDLEDFKVTQLQTEAALAQVERDKQLDEIKLVKLEGEKALLAQSLQESNESLAREKLRSQELAKFLADTKDEVSKKDATIKALESSLDAQTEKTMKLKSELEGAKVNAQSTEERLKQELHDALSNVEANKLEIKNLQEDITKAESQYRSVLDCANAKYQDETGKSSRLEHEVKQTKDALQQLQVSANEEKHNMNLKMIAEQRKVQELEQQVLALKAAAEASANLHTRSVEEHSLQSQSDTSKCLKLQEELVMMNTAVATTQIALQAEKEKNIANTNLIASLQNDVEVLSHRLKTEQLRCQAIEVQLNAINEHIVHSPRSMVEIETRRREDTAKLKLLEWDYHGSQESLQMLEVKYKHDMELSRNKLRRAEETLSEHEKEIDMLKEQLQTQRAALKKELEATVTQWKAECGQLATLKEECERSREKLTLTEKTLLLERESNTRLSAELVTCQQSKMESELHCATLTQELHVIQTHALELETRNAKEFEEIAIKLSQERERCHALRAKLDASEAQLKNIQSQTRKEYERLEKSEEEAALSRAQLEALDALRHAECAQLEIRLMEESAKSQTSATQVEILLQEIEQMVLKHNKEVEEWMGLSAGHSKRLTELEKEIVTTKHSAQQVELQHNVLSDELMQRMLIERQEMEERIAKVFRSVKSSITEVEVENARCRVELQGISEKYDAKAQEVKHYLTTIVELENQLTSTSQSSDVLEVKNRDLNVAVQVLRRENEILQRKIQKVTERADVVERDALALKDSVEANERKRKREMTELQDRLKHEELRVTKLDADNVRLVKEVELLKSQIQADAEMVQALDAEITSIKGTAAGIMSPRSVSEMEMRLNAQIEALQHKGMLEYIRADRAESLASQYKAQIENLENELQKEVMIRKTVTEDVRTAVMIEFEEIVRNQTATLQKLLEAARDKCTELEAENEIERQKAEEYKQQFLETTRRWRQLEKDFKDFEANVRFTEEAVYSAQEEVASLKAKLHEETLKSVQIAEELRIANETIESAQQQAHIVRSRESERHQHEKDRFLKEVNHLKEEIHGLELKDRDVSNALRERAVSAEQKVEAFTMQVRDLQRKVNEAEIKMQSAQDEATRLSNEMSKLRFDREKQRGVYESKIATMQVECDATKAQLAEAQRAMLTQTRSLEAKQESITSIQNSYDILQRSLQQEIRENTGSLAKELEKAKLESARWKGERDKLAEDLDLLRTTYLSQQRVRAVEKEESLQELRSQLSQATQKIQDAEAAKLLWKVTEEELRSQITSLSSTVKTLEQKFFKSNEEYSIQRNYAQELLEKEKTSGYKKSLEEAQLVRDLQNQITSLRAEKEEAEEKHAKVITELKICNEKIAALQSERTGLEKGALSDLLQKSQVERRRSVAPTLVLPTITPSPEPMPYTTSDKVLNILNEELKLVEERKIQAEGSARELHKALLDKDDIIQAMEADNMYKSLRIGSLEKQISDLELERSALMQQLNDVVSRNTGNRQRAVVEELQSHIRHLEYEMDILREKLNNSNNANGNNINKRDISASPATEPAEGMVPQDAHRLLYECCMACEIPQAMLSAPYRQLLEELWAYLASDVSASAFSRRIELTVARIVGKLGIEVPKVEVDARLSPVVQRLAVACERLECLERASTW
eukprot:PhF_6_TR1975/c0_g1_i1/m.3279